MATSPLDCSHPISNFIHFLYEAALPAELKRLALEKEIQKNSHRCGNLTLDIIRIKKRVKKIKKESGIEDAELLLERLQREDNSNRDEFSVKKFLPIMSRLSFSDMYRYNMLRYNKPLTTHQSLYLFR